VQNCRNQGFDDHRRSPHYVIFQITDKFLKKFAALIKDRDFYKKINSFKLSIMNLFRAESIARKVGIIKMGKTAEQIASEKKININ